jgi:hypothetical protein
MLVPSFGATTTMRTTRLIAALMLALALVPPAYAQAAGAGADFNKAERERLKKEAEAKARQQQCMRDCDTIFKGQYAACGGYALTAQPVCTLNIDKNKAQCYLKCK